MTACKTSGCRCTSASTDMSRTAAHAAARTRSSGSKKRPASVAGAGGERKGRHQARLVSFMGEVAERGGHVTHR